MPQWRRFRLFAATAAVLGMPLALTPGVRADELPIRKVGLWELKMSVAGSQLPSMTMQQCTDEASDRDMSTSFGPMQKDLCSKNETRKTADGYVIDAVCTTAGISVTSHSEITGDFNSGYSMKVSYTSEGGSKAVPRDTGMTIDAKWVGACKPDQKAGDVVMPGGIKINIKDMLAMKGLTRKP